MSRKYASILLLFLHVAISLLLFSSNKISGQELECSAKDLRYSLKHEILDQWYPRTIDSIYGGFLCDYTYDWKSDGPQNKMLVTQARHIWTASQAALFFNDSSYREMAGHGYLFLRDIMWDEHYGGFFMLLDRKGKNVNLWYADTKSAYGNAFALYGLSSYYSLTGDTSVLNLAKKTFFWLESHSHDSIYGGYFDQLMRDGSNYLDEKSNLTGIEKKRACWKDYNSSIHLLEAFTELYKVWPDSLVQERIIEMLTIIRKTLTTEKGYMKLYFERDWTPVSYSDSSKAMQQENLQYDHVSFGHDIETAYLMLEALHVTGLSDSNKTLEVAKKMVDHALAKGWDETNGGFYDMGYYYNRSDSITIINPAKIWWSQAEGLNSLLMMSQLFPEEKKYIQAFIKQWNYINTYLIDHANGEWYMEGLDNSPEMIRKPKATEWKVNYHNSRALMKCIRMLENKK